MEASQVITRHGRETKNLRLAMQRAEEVVGKLQDALEEDRIEEGRLEALKEHLKEAEEDLSTQQGSYQESVVSGDKAKELMRVSKERRAAIDVRIDEVSMKLKKAESRALECLTQRRKNLQQKDAAINAARDANERFAYENRKRESLVKVVIDHTAQAEKVSARVPVPPGDTADLIEAKLEKLDKDLQRGVARYFPYVLP